MEDPPRPITLLGKTYQGQRVTNSATNVGYIHISDPATGKPVARITHFGMDRSMTLDAYGNVLSRALVEELFARADLALA